jgi:zinc transporter 9
VQIEALGWEMWSVLGLSFAVDGWVFAKALRSLMKSKPPDVTLYQHWKSIRDPTTAAVLMEDGAACLGILIAISGIGATQITGKILFTLSIVMQALIMVAKGLVLFDGIAGMLISGLLAHMGIYLSLLNHKYLIGYSVDPKITANIRKILLSRPSIEAVHSEQSQWVGPYRFSYKAEVEYDGTYLAAKLMRRYQHEFLSKKLDVDDIKVLLAW